MKRAIFLALLILGAACGAAQAESYSTSKEIGVSFDVPDGWKVKELEGYGNGGTVFVSPANPDGSQPRPWTSFGVVQRLPGQEGYPLPKDLAEAVAEHAKQMKASEEVSEVDVQFAGMPAKKLTYFKDPGTPEERRAICFLVFKRDGSFFRVSFLCETPDYDQDWPGGKQLIESFRFN